MGILSPRRRTAVAFPMLVAGVLATVLAVPGIAVDVDAHPTVGHSDTGRPAAAPATPNASVTSALAQQYVEAATVSTFATAVLENQFADAVRQNEFLDAANRLVQERAASAPSLARSTRAASGGGGGCNGDVACFLACTRAHESDTAGGYSAVSGGGRYRGAYQFDQQTWDSNAAAAGRPDLVGQDPAAVDPAAQDQVAASTYTLRGSQPWGGRC